MFIIYINDICDLSKRYRKLVTFKLFADDVKVYTSVNDFNSADQLQTCLNDVSRWADDWQLKLSPNKCCVLQVDSNCLNSAYYVCGVCLPLVNNMRDLGVSMDKNLNFKLHINEMCVKAKQRASLILRCFYTRNKNIFLKRLLLTLGRFSNTVALYGRQINVICLIKLKVYNVTLPKSCLVSNIYHIKIVL